MTTAGINIGSLYVIDPRPDICLTEFHKETLGVIADAVMEYLETSRRSLEGGRLANLLTGLNSFVQGEARLDPINEPLSRTPASSELDRSRTPSPLRTLARNLEKMQVIDKISPRNAAQVGDVPKPTSKVASTASTHDQNPSSRQILNAPRNDSISNKGLMFHRAAQIMRKSLDLGEDGGVVIFDANVAFGLDQEENPAEMPITPQPVANICAISTKNSKMMDFMVQLDSIPASQMDRSFLKRMLRRFRKGALWYFHQDGTTFSSDEDTSKSSDEENHDSSPQESNMSQPRPQGVLREKDLQLLKKYFPEASRIIFVPLWDSFNSRWFGGCFCWSSVESRIFSSHVELGGVFGFGSSLMIEHSRIQSLESDKKKGDFISSIS